MVDNPNNIEIKPGDFEPLDKQAGPDNEKIAAPSLTFGQDVWRRLKSNKTAFTSFIVLILLFLMAFGGQALYHHDPNNQEPKYANLPPKIPGVGIHGLNGHINQSGADVDAYKQAGAGSNVHYVLGTDYLGRDLFARIMYGTRVSLEIALIATLIDLTIGVGFGILSGWMGGRVDLLMQRIIEILSSVPSLVVMVLMATAFQKTGMASIIAALALINWTTMARLTRAQTLQLKNQDFILAARTLGESAPKIAWKHLLPNLSSVIIIQTMFTIPNAIFFEAFLSYIGIGISSPQASLGTLISDGQKNFQFLPYQMWYPAIVLIVLMLAFNLLGDGMRDAFDPKSKR
ncbi:ABC transporter permease [Lactiplantibacillus sp. WILCCON 0030]|uniref:ABC transporter permease n=1 Tax=Lactiplantibacillus brownii TaxID=3069269 RepID=A0ABU1A801_9LACO|nr:ABC transporter permease [Lactiplantibacillus brownii]MDQ7937003.1 ABC transporter permease [Lactiplantibacillus brownii]